MKKRNCPACETPMLNVWQLVGMGLFSRRTCHACGLVVRASRISVLAAATIGTWLPIACAFLGFAIASGTGSGGVMLAAATTGFVVSGAAFMWGYFRFATLVAA
jgi:hypothetical protein